MSRGSYPYIGDMIYVDDTSLPEYGMQGKILSSKAGRVYNWDCDWDHTVQLLHTDNVIILTQDQVCFDEPAPKLERIAAEKARRRTDRS